jgi:uncharacterized surface protein with fasciclin (FAS1) repeats
VKHQLGIKWFGGVAAVTAIAMSLPLAVTAYGDPEPAPAPATTTATPGSPAPKPVGSGCDAYYQQVATGANSLNTTAAEPVATALANNPLLTTFNAAISGQLNPNVNLVNILNNGPYIVFAPVDDAFAKLPPEQLEALKTDSTALTSLLFYHMVLGIPGPEDVHGKLTTQEGEPVLVVGKGSDIKVNDAKVVCGAIHAKNARIYLIDTVLDPASAPESTNATDTTEPTATETATTEPAAAPSTEAPAAESPAAESPAAEAPAEAPAA